RMADKYSSELFRVVIAQITQTIGYSCTLTAPLELLQDVMLKFMQEIARDMHGHMEHANRVQPNLLDARQTLKCLHINVQEILDFISNVESVALTKNISNFPIKRTSNMNFLKPGNTEIITRPMHIFEYLPPMEAPVLRECEGGKVGGLHKTERILGTESDSPNAIEKLTNNPIGSHSPSTIFNFPLKTYVDFDISRSVPEISSVVMTMGGFLSPAIEGKLPEAYIPDIIEKYIGLDAPPVSAIGTPTDEPLSIAKPLTNETVNNITEKSSFSNSLTTKKAKTNSMVFDSNNSEMSNVLNDKLSKKNKKIKQDITGFGKDKNKILGKNHDKAHRKALKMYQKFSKNQQVFENNKLLQTKKSKRRLDCTDEIVDSKSDHIEKMFKKQAKNKQKAIKGNSSEFQKNFVSNIESTPIPSMESTAIIRPLAKACGDQLPPFSDSSVPLTKKNIETNTIFAVQYEPHQPETVLSTNKIFSEPERNKLDVFKKISKPRTSKQEGLDSASPILFESTVGGPSLINLPSGTTITATPAVGSQNKYIERTSILTNHYDIIDKAPPAKPGIDMMIVNSSKPRKRGRKPAEKILIKNEIISKSLSDSVAKDHPTNAFAIAMALSGTKVNPNLPNIPSSTEPLNLCNAPVASGTFQTKAKEKKEKKKKSKFDFCLPENISEGGQIMFLEKSPASNVQEKSINVVGHARDQFLAASNTLSNASLYPVAQTGGTPLLPLLQFPPRPGLIPSGPGLFPSATGLVSFGNNPNNVTIPHFIPTGATQSVKCPSLNSGTDFTDTVTTRVTLHSDLKVDRNYCNVAPLVPETMQFSENNTIMGVIPEMENSLKQVPQKLKPKSAPLATGNLGDPIEVSDDSDESMQNKKHLIGISSPYSSHGRSSMLQPTMACGPPLLTNSEEVHRDPKSEIYTMPFLKDSEPIQTLQKTMKLSLPDVKNIINTTSANTSFSPFNLPSFKGGDKFSLAGGADLIPLSRTVTSSKVLRAPSASLSSAHPSQLHICEDQPFLNPLSNFENITIIPTGTVSLDLKMRKHHKKLKKLKEGKIKKKKDKKDKVKGKDRSGTISYKLDGKIKGADKKQKKEKKRDKQVYIDHISAEKKYAVTPTKHHVPITSLKPLIDHSFSMQPQTENCANQVPKLTLKLSGKSTPMPSLDKTNDIQDGGSIKHSIILAQTNRGHERDNSPELARFSPLVTGPPKTKQCKYLKHLNDIVPLPSQMVSKPSIAPSSHQPMLSNSIGWISNSNNTAASSTLSASSVLLPQQLMLTCNPVKNNFSSVGADSQSTASRKLSPPIHIPDDTEVAGTNRPSSYVDAEGNRIWICPACGKVDDGSAMIGCDSCDAWYHWICVGITIAPKDNDDWFCRVCITKKKNCCTDKRKRRNKKK
ncbi:hypothetical protein KR018_008130, partial [Drosophila ironensis]